jgi:MFS family permease
MSQSAPPSALPSAPDQSRAWYRQLNGYHWLVLVVSTMAWAFDCLSQQIFNLTRKPAMDVLTDSPGKADLFGPLSTSALLVGWATGGIIFGIMGDRMGRAKTLTIMILCYSLSTGLCGLSTDLWGIPGAWVYIFFCFVTGVGAGGIFPIACTLTAESLPDHTRPQALGMVQTFSALGNVGAGFISLGMVALLAMGVISTHWRWMFSVGIVPSLLAIIVARKLREPEAWKRAHAEGRTQKAGLRELFRERRWRRNAIVGLLLAASGVVGLWGIGVFSNDLTQWIIGDKYDREQREKGEAQKDLQFVAQVVASPDQLSVAKDSKVGARDLLGEADRELGGERRKDVDAQLLYGAALKLSESGRTVAPESVLTELDQPDKDRKAQTAEERSRRAKLLAPSASMSSVQEHIDRILARQKARNILVLQWAAWTLIMFNVGAFFGMYAFARVTQKIGRRPTFAIFFTIALAATALAFSCMDKMPRDLWMVVLMGGAQLSVFGGYAIYFPELFPTRLRSTGTSFCYNVGRYVAAIGPLALYAWKSSLVAKVGDPVLAFRYAGVAMCSCFLVGLVALLFAPETKGQPLPE